LVYKKAKQTGEFSEGRDQLLRIGYRFCIIFSAMKRKYIFESERLGFRNWEDADIPKMVEISADPEVMEFFPAPAAPQRTIEFIERMQQMLIDKGYCYFAVDRLDTGDFIGFTGLCDQTYEAEFTPCVDIGWRLAKKHWGHGYATEGAKKCLEYAFNELKLNSIHATAPAINKRSIQVMEKAGMKKLLNFKHPRLINDERLVNCVCYKKTVTHKD
jgi:RimJ/RimL family protein N-acetyltransferase